MTREDFFRAVGEVREDQIEAAEIVKKQVHPWRRFGALAACLALIVTVAAASGVSESWRWKAIVKSFNPAAEVEEDPDSWKDLVRPFNPWAADSGGEAAAGGLDGTDYRTDNPNRPARPDYSTGVEIGQLSGPGSGETMMGMSACLAWQSPEEIFAQDTAIFRGTVRELHYFMVEADGGPMEQYYTRAIVEVTDPIRGNLTAGETCSLLWLGAKGYMSTSIAGALENLDVGGEAIFMPRAADRDTGWKEGDSYFCYADLADFYLSEGMRFVFADTAEGLALDRGTYEDLAEVESLDEVAAYIRDMIGEKTQPAAEPAEPQAEPSETVNVGPSVPGPSGAREMPGGAFVGEER